MYTHALKSSQAALTPKSLPHNPCTLRWRFVVLCGRLHLLLLFLKQSHATTMIVLPVKKLLVINEFCTRPAHQLLAEMFVLQQIQHVETLRVSGGGKSQEILVHEKITNKNVRNIYFPSLRSKTRKRLKRTLFNWTKQDKMCNFWRKSFFPSYIQHKNKNN